MKLKLFEKCVVCGSRTKDFRRVCDNPECDKRVYHGRARETFHFRDSEGFLRYKVCLGTPVYDKQ